MSEAKHTPLPWRVEEIEFDYYQITDRKGRIIGDFYQEPESGQSKDERDANAEYIVKAVNAYPELIEFVKICTGDKKPPEPYDHSPTTGNPTYELGKTLLEKFGELE